MPLPCPRTPGATRIHCFGNAYLDAAAGTIEFGARIYNTAEAARERALSHSIRDNLTYLGPIGIETVVPDAFVDAGVAADAPRREAVRVERERLAAEARAAEQQEAADAAEDPDDCRAGIHPDLTAQGNDSAPAATPDGTPDGTPRL